MKFRMKADVTFEAEDLDDAFIKLAGHFDQLLDDEPGERSLFLPGSEISVRDAEEDEEG